MYKSFKSTKIYVNFKIHKFPTNKINYRIYITNHYHLNFHLNTIFSKPKKNHKIFIDFPNISCQILCFFAITITSDNQIKYDKLHFALISLLFRENHYKSQNKIYYSPSFHFEENYEFHFSYTNKKKKW